MAVLRILFIAAVVLVLSFGLSVAQSPPTPPAQSPSLANSPRTEASLSAPVIAPQVRVLLPLLLSLLPAASAPSPSTFTSPPSPPASTTISLPPLATSLPPVEGTVMPEAPSSGAVTNKFALSGVLAAGFAAALVV